MADTTTEIDKNTVEDSLKKDKEYGKTDYPFDAYTSYDAYMALEEEDKKKEDANRAVEFSAYFEDFIKKLDDDAANKFKEKLTELGAEFKEGAKFSDSVSNIMNADDLLALIQYCSDEANKMVAKGTPTDEKSMEEAQNILKEVLLNDLQYIAQYYTDKERFFNREDFNKFMMDLITELKNVKFAPNIKFKDGLKAGLDAEIINLSQLENLSTTIHNSIVSNLKSFVVMELAKVPEDKIGIKLDDNGHTNFDKQKYESMGKVEENVLLNRLISMMPDFSQNLFTIGFIGINDDYKNLSDFALDYFRDFDEKGELAGEKFNHLNNNIDGFYTRVSSFEIPMPKAHTIQYKFFTRTITKLSAGIEQPHTIDITFNADQNGYIINHFQRMAGQFNAYPKKDETREISLGALQSMFTPGGFIGRDKTLNIFIKFNDVIGKDQFTGRIYNNDDNYQRYDFSNASLKDFQNKNGYNGFFLEDVQFLGFDNSIDFNRDSANPIEMTGKFRFNHLYRIVA